MARGVTPSATRPARPGDADAVLDLLRSHPGLEVEFHAGEFRVVDAGGRILACGRLRRHKDGSLELASVATAKAAQGQGHASAVVDALLAGVREPVYALALAPGFFVRHGFRPLPRDALPASVRIKAETLCASQPYQAMVRMPRP
jgi:N-acetylglutamate synthase-like GNAT family acetyltransferase